MNDEIAILRKEIEAISDQLCLAVQGEFGFTIEMHSIDESIQKLGMLINFVVDAARRAVDDVKAQNAKLTELDRLKSDFMANISHELRTPLTLILGPLEILLNNPSSFTEEVQENLHRMQRNAVRLYMLVNDVLDFTKLEAGKFVLNEELLDLNQLVSELVDDAQGLADERKLTLQFVKTGEVGLALFDKKMVEKIVLNLISNALKFTPEGGRINVQLEREKDVIRLTVADTGIGISTSQIERLFERFYQVDSSTTRAHEGTGIGLALIKQFTNLMGGEITVKSEEGKGSQFIVTLPARTSSSKNENLVHDKTSEAATQHTLKISLSQLTSDDKKAKSTTVNPQKIVGKLPLILVADDNSDMRTYIVSLLENSYEIITAENGKLAVDAAYQYRPHLILSDVMMPIMDGYQVTKTIKSDPELKHIPIILVTAKAGQETLVSGLGVGADDYLSKPFSPEELKARVNSNLRLYQSQSKLIKTNTELKNEIEERKKLESKNAALNNQLVMAARRAGMADIATSILHNIGNALNSVNISISMLDEKIKRSKLSNLNKLADLLQKHQQDMESFLANDPQGQHVPNYLLKLSDTWIKEKDSLIDEIGVLEQSVGHIKDIIIKQNALSTVLGMTEEVTISELIEDALLLNKISYERAQIEVIRDFASIKRAVLDKVKLLQILVNLIKNGIESLLENKLEEKQLTLCIQEENDTYFIIQIMDNGLGVLPENLTKIFSHGFTTKKTGHGFGLHTCALSAEEMGGSLSVESKGLGKGAKFILRLPYQPIQPRKENKK